MSFLFSVAALMAVSYIFPVFLFPATGLIFFSPQTRGNFTLFFASVTICAAGVYLNNSPLFVFLAVSLIVSYCILGEFRRKIKDYFGFLMFALFVFATAFLAYFAASDVSAADFVISKIVRILFFTFASHGEMALGESLNAVGFKTVQILPVLLFIFFAAGILISGYFLRRVAEPEKFSIAGLPVSVFVFGVSIFALVIGDGFYVKYLARNILIFMGFCFFLTGFLVIKFFFDKNRLPGALKIFLYVSMFFFYPIPVAAGILDRFANFRNKLSIKK
ncbi:MAG: DUF2232 domain-containing protein [Elusimicrobia bacterium]|nr:DUF2232 domain-containing protein [Elusimicrobiota bacterium]